MWVETSQLEVNVYRAHWQGFPTVFDTLTRKFTTTSRTNVSNLYYKSSVIIARRHELTSISGCQQRKQSCRCETWTLRLWFSLIHWIEPCLHGVKSDIPISDLSLSFVKACNKKGRRPVQSGVQNFPGTTSLARVVERSPNWDQDSSLVGDGYRSLDSWPWVWKSST